MDNKTYFKILKDTLTKKDSVLDELLIVTQLQETYLLEASFAIEQLNETFDKKENLIKVLNHLDAGFEKIYEYVKELLQCNNQDYKEEIIQLQKLIKWIMEKSARLQTLELKNKSKFDMMLSGQKKNIRDFKKNNKTVSNYYKNMANQYQGQSYFLDKKK